jgi:thiol:disulfide interchange protein DsbA
MKFAILRGAAAALLLAAQVIAGAQTPPVAKRDYLAIDPPRPAPYAGRIEVIEFFYYGCPVCYESQQYITAWRAAAKPDVLHVRVPSATSEDAVNFALTYYALEASGHLERLHGAIYENYHFDDQRLNDEAKLLEWLARNGVDAEAFRVLRDSSENRARVAAGRGVYESYNVRAVPTFAVDGRFLTSARLAGGVREMMDVVAYLVERAREERRGR